MVFEQELDDLLIDCNIMHVAALLSDLKSLSVCPHQAAINLVSVHSTIRGEGQQPMDAPVDKQTDIKQSIDSDLQRADELVSLHQNVKLKRIQSGPDAELLEARQAVKTILTALSDHR